MIYQQSVFDTWQIESESVQAVITSPPYYALRKYDIKDIIIGGDKNCIHAFELKDMELGHENRQGKGSNTLNAGTQSYIGVHGKKVGKQGFCIHCNAWQGQFGLEPTPQMYVEHTRLWAKEAWRVLRNNGVFFLNIADSYHNPTKWTNKDGAQTLAKGNARDLATGKRQDCGIPSKCQLLIPERVSIMLVEMGWIRRNFIVWYKPNAMPESVTDRFSKKWEPIFFFTKQEKYYFDLNDVRESHKEASLERVKHKWDGHREPMSAYANMDISRMCHPLGKNPGDVWIIPTQPSSEKHFAMWPERLVERMIKCSTKVDDIILDPFAGSGTTLKVAEQLHRKGIGIDLGYHEMSKRRTSKIQKEMFT